MCKITEPHKRRTRPDMGWSAVKEEKKKMSTFKGN
jgi:hypothetical protein